jgi:hypothetical protein
MIFPNGKRFAFSILDDTDDATLDNIKPVYDFLLQCGLRTTKTVWVVDCPEGSELFFAGETLRSKPYLQYVKYLAGKGVEIASHGATMESSVRPRTVEALESFKEEFGSYPRLFCSHGHNRDNLYWGEKRFQTTIFRWLFRYFQGQPKDYYSGELESSRYFWGDLAVQHITFIRNFAFRELNLLAVNPEMPYKREDAKYANYWFSTGDAPDVHSFNSFLRLDRMKKLEAEGGVAIISTHLGKGFVKDGKLNSHTADILRYIAGRPGWFVPVSEILDYLLKVPGRGLTLGLMQILRLESRFMMDRLLRR